MELLIGVVGPYTDTETNSGRMNVNLGGSTYVPVLYTTPNHSRYQHGFFAPPEINSRVLVAFDGTQYYYISTIVDWPDSFGAVAKDAVGNPAPLFADKVHDTSGRPCTMMMKNSMGAGIKIDSIYEADALVNAVTVKSSQGHKLVLSDSAKSDAIFIQNKDNDGIVISGGSSEPYAGGCIKMTATNSHSCTVKHGDYSVRVNDGRDITLRNDSKGLYAYYVPDPILNPIPVGISPALQYGNVNLISKFRDINIYTDVPVAQQAILPPNFSNIFISTNQGMVQINSNGDVKIFSKTGGVTVQSLGDINLVSNAGSINLQAAAGINLNTPANININASQNLNAQGAISTNLGSGSPLHLNKQGGAIPAPPRPIPPEIPKLNVYGK